MSLENKSLGELEDVEGWIKLRRKEAKPGPRSDDDITS